MNTKRIKDFEQLSSEHISSEDVLLIMDDPNGSSVTKKITIGQLKNILYPPYQLNPSGMARIVTVKSSGNFDIQVTSSTGYIATQWWDGSVDIFGSGNYINYMFSKAIPTGNNWSKSSPKEIFVWSCSSGNATQSGQLIEINATHQSIASIDIKGLTSLGVLSIQNNQLTYLDISFNYIYNLNCSNNYLTELNLENNTNLSILTCYNNNISALQLKNNLNINQLNCSNNNISTLELKNNSDLSLLDCSSNNLINLDISNTNISSLDCSNNNLTSINAIGKMFGGVGAYTGYPGSIGANLTNNNLDALALNKFYTDINPADPGFGVLDVTDNPGSASDNPSIATNKGYIVLGT